MKRPRLLDTIRLGLSSKLTLVSAPAGFGKTTAVAEAIAGTNAGVAWLSLDAGDRDPISFWTGFVAALEKAGIQISPLAASSPNDKAFLTTLVNVLGGAAQQLIVVLDDYHLADSPTIAGGMTFLLEHLPPQVHMVISTRADPALPLARLRANGDLTEVRTADLRFTSGEATAYLNKRSGLDLADADIGILEQRTEGWIAALQLAALSISGREDPSAFIATFAGSDRYVVDYLLEEVLQRQSDETRRFLHGTAFLDRLNGPLCDAVMEASGSKAQLERLERQNLFVIPLDARREWYRYHHLFADVLVTHLPDAERALLPERHRRASGWFEAHGERETAIHHALAAEDYSRAADLLELAIPAMRKDRSEARLAKSIEVLPKEVLRSRPVLAVGFAGILASLGRMDEVEALIADGERALAALEAGLPLLDGSPVLVVDQSQVPQLPGAIALYRCALAQVRGDIPAAITHAEQVLDLAPVDDHLARAGAAGFLGIAFWSGGDLVGAQRAWTECLNGLRRVGHVSDVFGATIALTDIALARGRLREARAVHEHGLQLARAEPVSPRGTADIYAGLSTIAVERNDLDVARAYLAKSEELGESAGLPQHPYRLRLAKARLELAEGNANGAIAMLDEAERVYVSDFFPYVRPIPAMRARIQIARGEIEAGRSWADGSGVFAEEALTYLREYDHITLVRLLLAEGEVAVAAPLLDRLLDAAETGGRTGSVIELLILQALGQKSHGNLAAALPPLERALSLAQPEGYVRLFLDEGQPMLALLRAAQKHGGNRPYIAALLAAGGATPATPPSQDHPELIEPLSDRELDVLRLLRSDLDGPEIARELMVSLNTMRTHTKKIYEKLGVSSRRAAVTRAEELNLLTRH